MWAYLGFGGLAGLFLFLIISFRRFQYFNLHSSSLKLCFTNLVLEIQDNLSLIFVFIRDIKLDLFYSFSAIPHNYGSYLKIQAQLCPICQNLINPKTIQVLILWPLFGSLDRESWAVYDLMRLSFVAFIK